MIPSYILFTNIYIFMVIIKYTPFKKSSYAATKNFFYKLPKATILQLRIIKGASLLIKI